jgi:hypothetical protein
VGLRQASSPGARGQKWFITEKLRYYLCKVTQRSSWPVFVTEGKIARFEALAPALNYRQTDSGFSEDSTKFSMHRLGSLPVQEEAFYHSSLVVLAHFDWVNVFLTF